MLAQQVVAGVREVLGVDGVDLEIEDATGHLGGVLRVRVPGRTVIVKIDRDGIGRRLIPRILREKGIALPASYGSYAVSARIGDTGGREPQAYLLPALRGVLPVELGRFEADGRTALVLEDLAVVAGLEDSASAGRWPTEDIEMALRAAAGFHADTAGQDFAWTVQRPTTRTMLADTELWRAVLTDAATRFPDIVTPQVLADRLNTVATIAQWHRAKDAMPACLVHDGFNPRNVGLRDSGEVVALDWARARVDTPQRDVAELLTFTLDAHSSADEVLHLLAVHWQALADHGLEVDPGVYARAAAAEFRVASFDAMCTYMILGAGRGLPYLKRINRTVDHLVALTGE